MPPKSKPILNEKGVIPLLVLLAVVGLIAFLAISSFVNFQSGGLFATLFNKSGSYASGPAAVPAQLSVDPTTGEFYDLAVVPTVVTQKNTGSGPVYSAQTTFWIAGSRISNYSMLYGFPQHTTAIGGPTPMIFAPHGGGVALLSSQPEPLLNNDCIDLYNSATNSMQNYIATFCYTFQTIDPGAHFSLYSFDGGNMYVNGTYTGTKETTMVIVNTAYNKFTSTNFSGSRTHYNAIDTTNSTVANFTNLNYQVRAIANPKDQNDINAWCTVNSAQPQKYLVEKLNNTVVGKFAVNNEINYCSYTYNTKFLPGYIYITRDGSTEPTPQPLPTPTPAPPGKSQTFSASGVTATLTCLSASQTPIPMSLGASGTLADPSFNGDTDLWVVVTSGNNRVTASVQQGDRANIIGVYYSKEVTSIRGDIPLELLGDGRQYVLSFYKAPYTNNQPSFSNLLTSIPMSLNCLSSATPTPNPTSPPPPPPGSTPSPTGSPLTVDVQAAPGWTMVGLPLQPTNAAGSLSSNAVLTNVLSRSQGAFAETANWTGSSWQTYLMGSSIGSNPVGTNFNFNLGKGYFVYSDKASSFQLTGNWVTTSPTVTLNTGWNLLSFPTVTYPNVNASAVLSSLSNQVGPLQIVTLVNGQYTILYSDTSGYYGSDFVINPNAGYWVYITQVTGNGSYKAPFTQQTTANKSVSIKSSTIPPSAPSAPKL